MTDVVLTGLAANDPVPGNYIEVNFAQGPSSNGSTEYSAILIGNKTSSGSATTNSIVYGPTSGTPLSTEADAKALFGAGSELHLMWNAFAEISPETTLYAIAVTASGGTAATRDHVVATTAAANGNIRFWLGDQYIDTAVVSGDTAGTICTNIVASINSKTDWPVTASVVTTTTVRITAKIAGPRGNWHRTMVSVQGASIATTITNSASGYLTSGATADDNTTALATIAGSRYYYQVSAAEDATQLGALATQINSIAAPTTGLRCRAFGGSIDTSGNAITVATGINGARVEIGWLAQADVPPCILAARLAAVYALNETNPKPRKNFSGYGKKSGEVWTLKAPLSGAVPSRTTIKSLLNNGITPIGCSTMGATYIVKRITTKCLDGATSDFRIRDAHKVTVCDFFADDWSNKCVLQFSGKDIGDDPVAGGRVPGESVVTPRVAKAAMIKLLQDYEENDNLENVATTISSMTVVRSSSPTTRLGLRVKLDPRDICDQIATAFDQV